MSFKDHFSGRVAEYARFRPTYPRELFEYVASLARAHALAWDCATGSGQAAISLTGLFDRVIATDASAHQISSAQRHDRVHYRVAPAEKSGLPDNAIDVVTVAQALHWFDIPAFFAEATRVLKPAGVIAVWTYDLLSVTPEIDRILQHLYQETTRGYWPPERVLVDTGYRTIAFPFDEIAPREFEMSAHWSCERLLGYVQTWSAMPRLIAARGLEPVLAFINGLRALWGDPRQEREVRWPLNVRVGVSNSYS